jgi:hypothetical protein
MKKLVQIIDKMPKSLFADTAISAGAFFSRKIYRCGKELPLLLRGSWRYVWICAAF